MRIIAFIDRIEVHSLGRINKTSKLDVYVHYNFKSLAAENIVKVTPRWANGGGSKRANQLKNNNRL